MRVRCAVGVGFAHLMHIPVHTRRRRPRLTVIVVVFAVVDIFEVVFDENFR